MQHWVCLCWGWVVRAVVDAQLRSSCPPWCRGLSSTARCPVGLCLVLPCSPTACTAAPSLCRAAVLRALPGSSGRTLGCRQCRQQRSRCVGLAVGPVWLWGGAGCGVDLAVGWIWLWGTGPGAGHAARCHQGGMGWLHALTAACCVPGETFVLGDGPPGPLEPRMDPMDSALNAVNASGHSRSSREFRLQGYRHLHQPCSLSQGSTSALGRLGAAGRSMWGH